MSYFKKVCAVGAALILFGACSFARDDRGAQIKKIERAIQKSQADQTFLYACVNGVGVVESSRVGLTPQPCAHSYDKRVQIAANYWTPPTTTTTTTTTTTVPTTTCAGVPMTQGQPDINTNPAGTIFCLTGIHNWNLTPKTGDKFVGPAVLDGAKTTAFAFEPGTAANVTIDSIEIRNYKTGKQLGAILSDGTATGNPGWKLINLNVHDNGTSAGGAGVSLGPAWQVIGGRYWHNAQEGLNTFRGNGAVVDGAELDHNNLDPNGGQTISCADEAGGFKWFANDVTVKNSYIHDNACVGLWSDGNAHNSTVTNNRVVNNWAEGIFIEISTGATITGNTVTGNGMKGGGGSTAVCSQRWNMTGGGITISASNQVTVSGNTLASNCNGITGFQEPRPDGNPGLLQDVNVHDNIINGVGANGFGSFPVISLAGRNLTFTNNALNSGATYCGLTCN